MSLALKASMNTYLNLTTIVRNTIMAPKPVRIIFFDIETTGLNTYHDHVIEIAVKDNGGSTFTSLVKPPVPLVPKITELTGLTDNDLRDAPDPYAVAQKFCEFIQTADDTNLIMVGHNSIGFDCRFIRSWLGRLGIHSDDFNKATHVDTMRLSQYYYPGRYSYSLVTLCKYAGLGDGNQAHRAMGDVASTECLFNHIISDIRRRKGTTCDIMEICRPVIFN